MIIDNLMVDFTFVSGLCGIWREYSMLDSMDYTNLLILYWLIISSLDLYRMKLCDISEIF